MPNLPSPNYPSTEQELYSIADTTYDSLEVPENLAAFEAKKPGKYTPIYIASLRTHKTTAFNLPDNVMRKSIHETLRVELTANMQTCCGYFQDLKGYIFDGFPDELCEIKYNEAGMVDYDSASHKNWEKVVALNQKMEVFISTYPTQLTEGFMPSDFEDAVSAASSAFMLKYNAFKSSKETGVGTGAKIKANNLVYADLQNLQNDAHNVFRNDGEVLKQFVFLEVKKIVSPPGSASLGLDLIQDGTNLPIPNAVIIIQSKTGIAMQTTSDIGGHANFTKIDPDDYKVKIQITGKPDINLVKEVNTGVSARLKVIVT